MTFNLVVLTQPLANRTEFQHKKYKNKFFVKIYQLINFSSSWDSSVGIVTRLQARWFWVWIPVGARNFSFLRNIKTDSEAPPTLLLKGYWVFFLEVKWPECDADRSPPYRDKGEYEHSCTQALLICRQSQAQLYIFYAFVKWRTHNSGLYTHRKGTTALPKAIINWHKSEKLCLFEDSSTVIKTHSWKAVPLRRQFYCY